MKPAEDATESIRLDSKDFKGCKFEKFARTVDKRLLVRSNSDLHTFKLRWDDSLSDSKAVRTWMKYVVNHNVKVLDVILDDYDKSELPPCIFTCRSLQELNLQWGVSLEDDFDRRVMPCGINLPSLRKLTLCLVEVYQDSLDALIAHSPHLEDIHFTEPAMHLYLIASKVLKRLTIDGYIESRKVFAISTPHLVSFECIGYELKGISWRDQPTLESAHIDSFGEQFDGQSNYTKMFLHAKKLALLGSDMKVMLEKELPTCSAFQSLATLEVGGWHLTADLYVTLRFLQLSPRLEKLKLVHNPEMRDKEAGADVLPINGMTFRCPLLESVTIKCSEGDEGIDKLVSVLVANGVSLDKIHVTVPLRKYVKKRALDLEDKASTSNEPVKKPRCG